MKATTARGVRHDLNCSAPNLPRGVRPTWASVLHELDPSCFPETIDLISTVLGAGKDALARKYVSLAADTRVTSLDLRALFGGTS